MSQFFDNSTLGVKRSQDIIKANLDQQLGISVILSTDQFEKAVKDHDLEVYELPSLIQFSDALQKAIEDGADADAIEKAKKDLSKLIKTIVMDKDGVKRTVYIKRKEYASHTKHNVKEIEATIARQKSLLANPKSPNSAKRKAEEIIKVESAKLKSGGKTEHPYVKMSGAKSGEHPDVTLGRAYADKKHGTNESKKQAENYIAQNKKPKDTKSDTIKWDDEPSMGTGVKSITHKGKDYFFYPDEKMVLVNGNGHHESDRVFRKNIPDLESASQAILGKSKSDTKSGSSEADKLSEIATKIHKKQSGTVDDIWETVQAHDVAAHAQKMAGNSEKAKFHKEKADELMPYVKRFEEDRAENLAKLKASGKSDTK